MELPPPEFLPLMVKLQNNHQERIVHCEVDGQIVLLDIEDQHDLDNNALLSLALIETLHKIHPAQYIRIVCNDINFFNLLSRHLIKWKQNAWVMRTGKNVKHEDIYQTLYDKLTTRAYLCKYEK